MSEQGYSGTLNADSINAVDESLHSENAGAGDSVTQWLQAFRAGDQFAADLLWKRYFLPLVRSLRSKTPAQPVYDEEDAALSAFDAIFQFVGDGGKEELSGRQDFWRLLTTIGVRKAHERFRRQTALKRGGEFLQNQAESLDSLPSPECGPEMPVMVAEECQKLLDILPTGDLESVAVLKLEGVSVREIAAKLCISRWTVQRRVRLID